MAQKDRDMLNVKYQLVAPRRFEIAIKDEQITLDDVVVRPTHLSICNADQRYYQGTRGAAVMAQKLPMALIHEGIGEVLFDNTGTLSPGDTVVMIPNLPSESDAYVAENYLRSSRFRGSSADGFMQDVIVTQPDRLVKLPCWINKNVAAFTELVSVSMHAIMRFASFSTQRYNSIGVWGDGNLGFITALLLRRIFPDSKVTVFGHSADKLSDFTFVDDVYLTNEMPSSLLVDAAFECAGGVGSEPAIDQIIDHIAPEATISLLGVSENAVPINTRMVLEKGLRLFGSSRSGRKDFERTVSLFENDPDILAYLERIVGSVIPVRSIDDITTAFEDDIRKRFGKTVMEWQK